MSSNHVYMLKRLKEQKLMEARENTFFSASAEEIWHCWELFVIIKKL